MAKIAAHGSKLWLDEIAMTGYLNATDLGVDQEVIDVTCFGDAGPRGVVGNHKHSGNVNGFFDAATGAFDPEAFVDFMTDEDHYLAEFMGAAIEGTRGYERIIRLKSQPRSSKTGSAVLLNVADEGGGPICRAMLLRSATVTGTGSGTGQSVGATISGQITQVVYRVLAVTGSGSMTLQTHDSDDNAGTDPYASIAALASGALTAVGATRKTTTGVTKLWKRITVSAFSGFTNVTILATIGVVPNT